MKIRAGSDGTIVLTEVFSGVMLETEEGNQLGICMRDDSFELTVIRASDGKHFNHRIDMATLEFVQPDRATITDALRYRFIRDDDNWGEDIEPDDWGHLGELSHGQFDELIDRKMSRNGSTGGD